MRLCEVKLKTSGAIAEVDVHAYAGQVLSLDTDDFDDFDDNDEHDDDEHDDDLDKNRLLAYAASLPRKQNLSSHR
ncbi:hypothetical protein [Paenibacillus ginsengihumi]|uniref:hypothetical protein n=1 Tax=Paenibacillus ginsengihumi TaxID=431596 RepID=UPI00037A9B53|nr:hypothetical protein [Paenibacillus ginsengihumi]